MEEEKYNEDDILDFTKKDDEEQEYNKYDNEQVWQKNSIIGFVLGLVGVSVSAGWFIGGIASIVLGVLARNYWLIGNKTNKNPYRVFNRVTRVLMVVDVIIGILSIIGFIALSIKNGINAINN